MTWPDRAPSNFIDFHHFHQLEQLERHGLGGIVLVRAFWKLQTRWTLHMAYSLLGSGRQGQIPKSSRIAGLSLYTMVDW